MLERTHFIKETLQLIQKKNLMFEQKVNSLYLTQLSPISLSTFTFVISGVGGVLLLRKNEIY